MNYNNGCCMPQSNKNTDCSCKSGILCALDWFFQDFLLKPGKMSCVEELHYLPKLPVLDPITNPTSIPNQIFNIPYLTNDIVPIYITNDITIPYPGDITYLNICQITGFTFKLSPECRDAKEKEIQTLFSKIKFCSPTNNCCKNGVVEYLIKARDFLLAGEIDSAMASNSVILSNNTNSFRVTSICAINSDTVWAKFQPESDPDNELAETMPTYYVMSICDIVGITFDKFPSLEPPVDSGLDPEGA